MMSAPEVVEREDEPGTWSVEQIDDDDGDCYVTIFYGPKSAERARAYAEWLLEPQPPT